MSASDATNEHSERQMFGFQLHLNDASGNEQAECYDF